MDTNKDGVLTFDEIMNHYGDVESSVKDALKEMFHENDYNKDGVVSKRELFLLALRLIMLGAPIGESYENITLETPPPPKMPVNLAMATPY